MDDENYMSTSIEDINNDNINDNLNDNINDNDKLDNNNDNQFNKIFHKNDNENIENINIDNINLDEILDNDINKNDFIKYICDNGYNLDEDKYPNINIIGNYYIRNTLNSIYPRDNKNRYIIFLIRLIHMIGILFMSIGFLLPYKFLPYHIILCLIVLISWDILDNHCFMSIFVKYIGNYDCYNELLPLDIELCKMTILSVLVISVITYSYPEYSLFNLIIKLIEYLKKFN